MFIFNKPLSKDKIADNEVKTEENKTIDNKEIQEEPKKEKSLEDNTKEVDKKEDLPKEIKEDEEIEKELKTESKKESENKKDLETQKEEIQGETKKEPETQQAKEPEIEPEDKSATITIKVSAATILDNLDSFDEDKLDILPEDGIILESQEVNLEEGDNAFTVLQRILKEKKIHIDADIVPAVNSYYIKGINNIYEFDCGSQSGWMYKVNGEVYLKSIGQYEIKDGDLLEILYTCGSGKDIS